MANGHRRRFGKFRHKVLLCLISLTLCFAVLEVMFRLTEPPDLIDYAVNSARWDDDGNGLLHVRSSNRELVYELRPNSSVFERGFNQQITTNAAGFRDREFEHVKPPGVYRVIVVGDSIAFGWELTTEQLFAKLLEQRFSADGHPEFQAYNMAVDGYNSRQEVELIRSRVLDYEPDLLLIAYCLNDNIYGADEGSWRHFRKTWSRTYDWLSLYGMRLKQRLSVKDLTTEAFEDLAAIVGPRKLPVLIVVFPALGENQDGSYPFVSEHRQLARLADRLGFMILDLREKFQQEGFLRLRVQPNDFVHPNALGHKLASDAVYEFLNHPPASSAAAEWKGLPF